ncbi:hypothetical protein JW711_00260 [Candidatus Woesearchaeota archaeon]|nr:hypothetical protein [Candidatus Woesearchaeota archaeon]
MIQTSDLYDQLCTYKNLELAWQKARKHKTLKPYVIEFEKNLKSNLATLQTELLLFSCRPKPLKTFILRDPKTRVISKSDFRDRVVHHAICNIIDPLFEKTFIHDSYANRKRKGVLKAIARFDKFKRKASKNSTRAYFILKADIKHYFDNVDHQTLITILRKKIPDARLIRLIEIILSNHKTARPGRGMPLGNLTSQFFANVYLNELDRYVKHTLKAKYYIRYVDDFVILDPSKCHLEELRTKINFFLKNNLILELHPDKSKILTIERGVTFLGFRNYYYHRLLKKSNIRKIRKKLMKAKLEYELKQANYDDAYNIFEGWSAHSKAANTYKLRKQTTKLFEWLFPGKIADKEISKWLKIKPNNQATFLNHCRGSVRPEFRRILRFPGA